MKKSKLKKISIYIDGANFVYGIKTIKKGYKDFMFDFEKFAKKFQKGIPL